MWSFFLTQRSKRPHYSINVNRIFYGGIIVTAEISELSTLAIYSESCSSEERRTPHIRETLCMHTHAQPFPRLPIMTLSQHLSCAFCQFEMKYVSPGNKLVEESLYQWLYAEQDKS